MKKRLAEPRWRKALVIVGIIGFTVAISLGVTALVGAMPSSLVMIAGSVLMAAALFVLVSTSLEQNDPKFAWLAVVVFGPILLILGIGMSFFMTNLLYYMTYYVEWPRWLPDHFVVCTSPGLIGVVLIAAVIGWRHGRAEEESIKRHWAWFILIAAVVVPSFYSLYGPYLGLLAGAAYPLARVISTARKLARSAASSRPSAALGETESKTVDLELGAARHSLGHLAGAAYPPARVISTDRKLARSAASSRPSAALGETESKTVDLELVAARYSLGHLAKRDIPGIIDRLVDEGIYREEFLDIMYPDDETQEKTGVAFEKSLMALGIVVPTREEAQWAIVRYHISRIANGEIDPLDGIKVLMEDDVCRAFPQEDPCDIHELMGWGYLYLDLRFPSGYSVDAEELERESVRIREEIAAEAAKWISRYPA